jgi:hypothetical protein
MPSPHAGFAAVTVISETTLNQCLDTYLNTFLDGLNTRIQQVVPAVVSGSSLSFDIKATGVILSLRATLKKNAFGLITFTARFYSLTQVDVMRTGIATALNTYNPEVMIDATLTTGLLSNIHGNQYQFGVDLTNCTVNSINATFLSQGGLPTAYRSAVINTLQSPYTRNQITNALRSAARNPALTPGMVPASFDYHMEKPYQKGEDWFKAHIAASRVVYWPLDGALAVAVDYPGYTNGIVHDLHDFRSRGYQPSDIASATNLDFLQAFLNKEVLPQMHNAFVKGNVRINKVKRLEFKTQDFVNGTVHFIQAEFEISYWTEDILHFAVANTTEVSGITVTINVVPHLAGDKFYLLTRIVEVDLPVWIDIVTMGLSLILPPLSFFVPSMISSALKNAAADVSHQLNGEPSLNGLKASFSEPLPGTNGPLYDFTPTFLMMNCRPEERFAMFGANLRPEPIDLEFSFEDGMITLDLRIDRHEVVHYGGLPLKMTAELRVSGVVQKNDPTLRVRFETYLNDNLVPMYTRDLRSSGSVLSTVGGASVDPYKLEIDTIKMVSPKKTDQEVRITCRLYRAYGGQTHDVYNGTVYISSPDPRPDSVKPYVQWAHRVKYWNGFRMRKVVRRSKIHRAPGKGGCRFSNQYLLPGMNSEKFVSLRRFTGLPFDDRFIEANRKLVCPYCFFGGPDKQGIDPFPTTVELSGTLRKVFKKKKPH